MNGDGNRFVVSWRTDLIQHILILAVTTPTISGIGPAVTRNASAMRVASPTRWVRWLPASQKFAAVIKPRERSAMSGGSPRGSLINLMASNVLPTRSYCASISSASSSFAICALQRKRVAAQIENQWALLKLPRMCSRTTLISSSPSLRDTSRRKAVPVTQSAIVQRAVPLRRGAQALDAAFDQVTREYGSFDLTCIGD